MKNRIAVMAALVVVAAGCGRNSAPQTTMPNSAPLGAPGVGGGIAEGPQWLCMPDKADDPCHQELSTTELLADGTRKVVAHARAAQPKADCFYVYPTVDLATAPGNHTDFRDLSKERAVTIGQAARFGEHCAMYVPLYRQVTIGTFFQKPAVLEKSLALAYSDVEGAFRKYLAHTPSDRKIVLIGHSQGAEMITRLLKQFFDNDPAMRARLLLAMPIGGHLQVAAGKTVGGDFANIPVCTRPGESSCIVGYRTYAAGASVAPDRWLPDKGNETVCVDPKSVDGVHALASAIAPVNENNRRYLRSVDGVTTPYVDWKEFYTSRCVKQPSGFAYLEVTESPGTPTDQRKSVIDFTSARLKFGNMGLHLVDMQLTQGDLVDMVARRLPQ